MRLIKLLAFLSLQLRIIVAYTAAEDKFQKFYPKLIASAPLTLDEYTYTRLTAEPRNYSTAVLLTAIDPRFGCHLCREFQEEWDLLSKSWTRGDKRGNSRLIFGTLDFTVGRNIFQALGLQTAPALLLFPPTHGPFATSDISPIRFDFTIGPHSAERIHAWISRHLHGRPHPQIQRPTNWTRVAMVFTIFSTLIALANMVRHRVLPILRSRNIWAAISLISILLFTSGHMFNHIRKVPYVLGDGHGGISYFAGGFSNQLGLETQIIAGTYALLSFATISLAVKVPRIIDPISQHVAVTVWSCVTYFTYSLLLFTFRIKNDRYPFRLPPFL